MGTTWEPLSWNGSGGLISVRKIEENCSGSKHFTLLSLFAVQQLKQSSSLRTDPILCHPLTPRCSRALPQPPSPSTFHSLSLSLPLQPLPDCHSSYSSINGTVAVAEAESQKFTNTRVGQRFVITRNLIYHRCLWIRVWTGFSTLWKKNLCFFHTGAWVCGH